MMKKETDFMHPAKALVGAVGLRAPAARGALRRPGRLARSLGNARAFPQPRDLTGSSPREGPET